MSLKKALKEYLDTKFDVPITPDVSRQKTLPYIVYQFIGAEHQRHMLAGAGFTSRLVQFDIYAATALEADTLMETLRENLDNYKGNMGTDNLFIRGAFLESERDDLIDPVDASQTGKHRRTADFTIWHSESVSQPG